jgi:acetoacetyl-CoA synthetase
MNLFVLISILQIINGASISSVNPATLRNAECLEEYVALGERLRSEIGM